MEENTKPSHIGKLDVALWEKIDKNGKPYYTLKIGNICNMFINEPIKD